MEWKQKSKNIWFKLKKFLLNLSNIQIIFLVYLKIIGIVVGLTIVSLFVSCMNSLPNYTKPHRYIVQDEIYNNDDDL